MKGDCRESNKTTHIWNGAKLYINKLKETKTKNKKKNNRKTLDRLQKLMENYKYPLALLLLFVDYHGQCERETLSCLQCSALCFDL